MAAKFTEEQLIWGRACWRGDISCDLGAAADPVMDVVTQVSSQITAVWQNVQRDAREGEKGSDFLQWKKLKLKYLINRCYTGAQTPQRGKQNSRQHVFGALAKDKLKAPKSGPIAQMLSLTHAEPWDTVQ